MDEITHKIIQLYFLPRSQNLNLNTSQNHSPQHRRNCADTLATIEWIQEWIKSNHSTPQLRVKCLHVEIDELSVVSDLLQVEDVLIERARLRAQYVVEDVDAQRSLDEQHNLVDK